MKLSLIPNIFPDEIQVDNHHIIPNSPIVIPLPRKIHKQTIGNRKKHFDFNNKMIEKLYGLSIKKLIEEDNLLSKNKIENLSGFIGERWGEITIREQGSGKNNFIKTKSLSIVNSSKQYTVKQYRDLLLLGINLSEKYTFDDLEKILAEC